MNRIACNASILVHGLVFCVVEELFPARMHKGYTRRQRDIKIVDQGVSGGRLAHHASYTWDSPDLVALEVGLVV